MNFTSSKQQKKAGRGSAFFVYDKQVSLQGGAVAVLLQPPAHGSGKKHTFSSLTSQFAAFFKKTYLQPRFRPKGMLFKILSWRSPLR
jgi:hypothetical protein